MIIYIILFVGLCALVTCLVFSLAGLVTEDKSVVKTSLISLGILILSIFAFNRIDNHFDKMPYQDVGVIKSTEYIQSLQDNSEVNGRFHGSRYAIRGYINEETYYSYMVKLSDNGLIMNKVPANRTTVYEVDSNFRVEWFVESKEFCGLSSEHKYWKLYIPKNSVIDEYAIDLK